jgi:hypothetical protein
MNTRDFKNSVRRNRNALSAFFILFFILTSLFTALVTSSGVTIPIVIGLLFFVISAISVGSILLFLHWNCKECADD